MLDDPAIVRPDTGRLWLASPSLQCCTGSFAARQEPRPPNSGNVLLEFYDWLLSRPRYPKRLPQSSFRPRIAHGDLNAAISRRCQGCAQRREDAKGKKLARSMSRRNKPFLSTSIVPSPSIVLLGVLAPWREALFVSARGPLPAWTILVRRCYNQPMPTWR